MARESRAAYLQRMKDWLNSADGRACRRQWQHDYPQVQVRKVLDEALEYAANRPGGRYKQFRQFFWNQVKRKAGYAGTSRGDAARRGLGRGHGGVGHRGLRQRDPSIYD
ncbi:MAG: hypothetical protein IIA59_00540 [Candidatus Marinimicrobia bacterium]|nr:hypothetical protein [Candidatus Neomarinimicrobiota bacterium]